MYRTSEGERVLHGAEASLFREALATTVEELLMDGDDGLPIGIPAFDRLTLEQKLALLATVGSALLDENTRPPELTQPIEATVGAIFEHLRVQVHVEIDEDLRGDWKSWRQRILDVFDQEEGMDELPDADCDDHAEWDLLIECLSDRILWDCDWLDEGFYVDDDPNKSRALKQIMGIDEDYFNDVPPDPNDEELEVVVSKLQSLIGWKFE